MTPQVNHLFALAHLHAPDPDDLVGGGRRHKLRVVREHHRVNAVAMAFQYQDACVPVLFDMRPTT
jgi:hypothetical protein